MMYIIVLRLPVAKEEVAHDEAEFSQRREQVEPVELVLAGRARSRGLFVRHRSLSVHFLDGNVHLRSRLLVSG